MEWRRGPARQTTTELLLSPFESSYMIVDSIIYLTITDKSYPRKLAFSYLSELSIEFARSYPPTTSLKAGLRPYAFVKFDTFIQRTKRLYLDPRGAEASGKGASNGLEQLNEDLQDVTRIMTKNMEDLLWRGDSLDRMSTMSSSLRDESLKYRKQARQINLDALYRKWAPVGMFGLIFLAIVYWKFCEAFLLVVPSSLRQQAHIENPLLTDALFT